MILSGLLVILVGYMIQTQPAETPSQFLGADTCDSTCGDGPVVGSGPDSTYGMSAFDDDEYDI